MYTDKHGVTMDGMNKGSTCRRTGSPIDEQMMHAKICSHERTMMQRCVREHIDEEKYKDVFTDRWVDEHALFANG